MRKVKNKTVNVRKQLKVKLENTATRYKNTVGFKPTPNKHIIGLDILTDVYSTVGYQWLKYK